MKNILKILLPYLLFSIFNFLYAITDCGAVYNCSTNVRPPKNTATELTCTLPAMPNMQITAEDVFDTNRTLKYYFGTGKTVCDVLGWMNEGASKFSEVKGMDVDIDTSLDLVIGHMEGSPGGSTGGGSLNLDSDSFLGYGNQPSKSSTVPDGNKFATTMQHTTVHEFFHIAQSFAGDDFGTDGTSWVTEGTARMFEDIVYDSENPYAKPAYQKIYDGTFIEDILGDLTSANGRAQRYRTFLFWKLLQSNCQFDLSLLLDNTLANFYNSASTCSDVSNINNDKLAGAFVLYNRAMILYNDVSLIESDEPSVILRIDKQVIRADKPNFSGSLDLKSYAGSSLPAFSAKSFLITYETLASSGDMNFTFKSNGDLKLVAVRVKADGSSDINDNFVMDSTTQTYKLTELDREGGLFVTLLNTTGEEITIDELKLTEERFIRDDENNTVTDNLYNIQWKDNNTSEEDVMSFYAARNYCSNLDYSGYTDWRLPFITELENLVFYDAVKEKSRISSKFKNIQELMYWSSNVYNDPGSAYDKAGAYYFYNFNRYEYDVRTTLSVVCVRDKN